MRERVPITSSKEGSRMKHLVTIDSLFDTMKVEARVQGATPDHLRSLYWLEQTSEKVDEEYNPFKRAELEVGVEDHDLRIRNHEADDEGNLVANGEWCLISIDQQGSISMTTSHEPEFIHVIGVPD